MTEISSGSNSIREDFNHEFHQLTRINYIFCDRARYFVLANILN